MIVGSLDISVAAERVGLGVTKGGAVSPISSDHLHDPLSYLIQFLGLVLVCLGDDPIAVLELAVSAHC
jgi:hypothetical protein